MGLVFALSATVTDDRITDALGGGRGDPARRARWSPSPSWVSYTALPLLPIADTLRRGSPNWVEAFVSDFNFPSVYNADKAGCGPGN